MTRATIRLAAAAVCLVALASLPAAAGDGDKKDDPGAEVRKKGKRPAFEKVSAEEFAGHDKNNDGILRGAEVPQDWSWRFDRDGDGSIGRGEFLEINSRPEKLRFLHPMRDVRARAATALAMFDKNKDGLLQRDEYPDTNDVFKDTDRNRNGTLDPPELLAQAEDQLEGIRKKMKSPNRYEFLDLFDVDNDDKVGADEYDGPAAPFRKFDTDADGVVTYDELYPERMKSSKDGKGYEGPKPEQISAIQALDKDDDGRVARAEFAGSDAAWRRLDVNGDGFITNSDRR